MEDWFRTLGERRRARLPEIVVEAYDTVVSIALSLAAAERIYLPRPSGYSLMPLLHMCAPHGWCTGHPRCKQLDLEVIRNEEEQAEYDAETARLDRQWEETQALMKEAKVAYDSIAPIARGSESLKFALARVCYEGKPITHPDALRAVIRFRDTLVYYLQPQKKRNLAVEAFLIDLDQTLDRMRDNLRRIILKRLFERGFAEDEEREVIALLEVDAANGNWPDPEADLEWAEAQVA